MKFQILGWIAVAALAGCMQPQATGSAAVETDHNVLTGGPVSGTTLNDVPQAVRDTIRQVAPQAEISDIDRTKRSGRVVYDVSFTRPGWNRKIEIAADGELLSQPDMARP